MRERRLRFDPRRRGPSLAGWALGLTLALAGASAAQDLRSFEARTTVHVLPNGWTFLIVERPVAPVFSFATYVNAGSAQEVTGITGLAHMFEHMAFKGTPNIGSTDYTAERMALEELEAAYQTYQTAREAPRADENKVKELYERFKEKQAVAAKFVVKNEFGDIVEREGGTGLNAFTAEDVTAYFYSLPANKTELFAYLESERFLHPVFREFYEERDVVQEERRLRTESLPFGRLIEQWVMTAFVAHPYHNPGIGFMSDLQSITLTDADAFFRKYYTPANMVTAIVGQVKAAQILPLLDKYFGRIPAGPLPAPLRTVEPPQIAERTVVLKDPAQPIYLESYHKPAATAPDQAVYDAIDDILSNGRTSRLYRSLVRDKKIAVHVQSFSGFPGQKYPNLWGVFGVPARGSTNEQVRDAIRAEIERLKAEEVSDEELAKFKTRAKADLLRSLGDNEGLAAKLADYQTLYGDWRELFRYIGRLDQVSKAEIRRVATETLIDSNRTVAILSTEAPKRPAPAGAPPPGGRP